MGIIIPTTTEAVSLQFRAYKSQKSSKLLGYLQIEVKSMVGAVVTSFPVFTWQDKKTSAMRIGVIGKLDYKVGDKSHSHGYLSRDLKSYVNRILEENSSLLTGDDFVEADDGIEGKTAKKGDQAETDSEHSA